MYLTALQLFKHEFPNELFRMFLSTGCPVFDAFFRGNSHFFVKAVVIYHLLTAVVA